MESYALSDFSIFCWIFCFFQRKIPFLCSTTIKKSNFFGTLTFSRKNGNIKDFSVPAVFNYLDKISVYQSYIDILANQLTHTYMNSSSRVGGVPYLNFSIDLWCSSSRSVCLMVGTLPFKIGRDQTNFIMSCWSKDVVSHSVPKYIRIRLYAHYT